MKILMISVVALLTAGCGQESRKTVVSISDTEITLNSKPVADLEKELILLSCSDSTKLILRANKGVSYELLEKAMKKISNAGCMHELELERI